jgi:hypothetical protein
MRHRLVRRLARKYRATDHNPPAQAGGDTTAAKIRTAAAQLRRTARGDAKTLEVCNEIERLLSAGWTERRGPFEPRPAKLMPEWGDKPPPEWGET